MVKVAISLRALAVGGRAGKAGPDLFRSTMKRCSYARFSRCEDDGARPARRAASEGRRNHPQRMSGAFGYENWNILSAKIEATRPHAPAAPALSSTAADDQAKPT